MTDIKRDTQRALELGIEINRMFGGEGLSVVGATLAQALACWIIQHEPQERYGVLIDHLVSVRRMVEALARDKTN